MAEDPDLARIAREEVTQLEERATAAEQSIKILLLPKDPNDAKNTILEIRAGTGGDEAALFAGDLFRMYALRRALQLAVRGDVGVRGRGRRLQGDHRARRGQGRVLEAQVRVGVHRVQRVPATEAQGRIRTVDGDRRGAAGGRGGRRQDRREGPQDRHVPLERRRRPARQHDRLGGADHAPADRRRGRLPGRALADQEPREGDEDPALDDPRGGAGARQAAAASAQRKSLVGSGDRSRRSARTTSRRTG